MQKVEDYQVFLQQDHPLLAGDAFFSAQTIVRDWLLEQPYVVAAFTREDLIRFGSGKLFGQVQRTFHPQRSGDVLFVLAPYTVPGAKGMTHGSPWHYDTHVPLLLVGCGIRAGHFVNEVSPAAVASGGAVSRSSGADTLLLIIRILPLVTRRVTGQCPETGPTSRTVPTGGYVARVRT